MMVMLDKADPSQTTEGLSYLLILLRINSVRVCQSDGPLISTIFFSVLASLS